MIKINHIPILDEMNILIQEAYQKLDKQGRLLTDEQLQRVKWAHQQTKANNEIENIYFTHEEEKLFKLFEETRLPLSTQSYLINIYLEKVLAQQGYKFSCSR